MKVTISHNIAAHIGGNSPLSKIYPCFHSTWQVGRHSLCLPDFFGSYSSSKDLIINLSCVSGCWLPSNIATMSSDGLWKFHHLQNCSSYIKHGRIRQSKMVAMGTIWDKLCKTTYLCIYIGSSYYKSSAGMFTTFHICKVKLQIVHGINSHKSSHIH